MSNQYFEKDPKVASRPRTLNLRFGNVTAELRSDSGVFSAEDIDQGTAILLQKAPVPPRTGHLLDLGCGYGPIAIALALRSPAATVWAVDINERALELTRTNAELNRLTNINVVRPGEVPNEQRFDAIYSNPPIRIGKSALHELLSRWLSRLSDDGKAWLVVQRYLGSDSLVKWMIGEGFSASRLSSTSGYRIIEVGRPR